MADNTQENEQLYKAAIEVVSQALTELEELEKSDFNADADGDSNETIDPMAEPMDTAPAEPGAEAKVSPEESEAPEMDKAQEDEESEEKPEQDPEEDKTDDSDDEESDEDVQKAYKAAEEKMKKRGLKKSLAKSEKAPESDLRKSVDARFTELTKALSTLTAKIDAIGSQPVGKKGHSGQSPLKKSQEAEVKPSLTKSQYVNKLIDLQKSGNTEVTPMLVSEVESGRISQNTFAKLKRLIG